MRYICLCVCQCVFPSTFRPRKSNFDMETHTVTGYWFYLLQAVHIHVSANLMGDFRRLKECRLLAFSSKTKMIQNMKYTAYFRKNGTLSVSRDPKSQNIWILHYSQTSMRNLYVWKWYTNGECKNPKGFRVIFSTVYHFLTFTRIEKKWSVSLLLLCKLNRETIKKYSTLFKPIKDEIYCLSLAFDQSY